jgi:hypothetical protein
LLARRLSREILPAMIGVIANPCSHPVVSEFFELFKTPWEFYRSGRQYEVLLCDGSCDVDQSAAKLILIFGGRELAFDSKGSKQIASTRSNTVLSYRGTRIPIYGDSVSFREEAPGMLVDEESQETAIHQRESNGTVLARIGYDLFAEIHTLLTAGQPIANAGTPTLDLHIDLLRDLIVASGAALVEIPPVPEGYRFIASLTHDVDHPSIRQHRLDHTMFGFLYRAVVGSIFDVCRGRAPFSKLVRNLTAVLKVPLVHLGLAKDFWYEFGDYAKLENGVRSTFFVVPFKGIPGHTRSGMAPRMRACRYGAADVEDPIQQLISGGCEVGLHGIDAWIDSSAGRNELEQIRSTWGTHNVGVRMHWLYFDEQAPATLERAGADYDSTVGYNETVGYRAGTSQAYKPLGVARLLELPLHVMDTALFYPSYLDLSPAEAGKCVGKIIDHASRTGGCVTVNWHDRSIAPERLWGDFYVQTVEELKANGAWFATAGEAVSWFRKRRSAAFGNVSAESDVPQVKIENDPVESLPGLRLRVHQGGSTCDLSTKAALMVQG